jgi:inorganic triphosphatase YgiF
MAKAKIVTNLDAQASTGKNARIIARTRLEEMYSWERFVDDAYATQELHSLRIATKRLRYTLEIFGTTFPKECNAILKEIEQLQEELGALHDSDVMIVLLRLYLGEVDNESGYERSLLSLAQHPPKGPSIVNPELVAHVLESSTTPSPLQRKGLELQLSGLHQRREDQYASFRKHWYHLKGQDFRNKVFTLLVDE